MSPVSDAARKEMDRLLDEGIQTAARLLEKYGEFIPLAIGLGPDKETVHVQSWNGNDHPTSDEVLALLYPALRQGVLKGDYRAVAIVTDVRIRKRPPDAPQDALRVEIEHPDAPPVACFLPYQLQDGKLIPGKPTAQRTEPKVLGVEEQE